MNKDVTLKPDFSTGYAQTSLPPEVGSSELRELPRSDKPEVSCAGGCGSQTNNPEHFGWARLEITGRYRCGACTRALAAVSKLGS